MALILANNALPNDLSDLLELAINDLEIIEGDPFYEVDMLYWYTVDTYKSPVCKVCLAGSLLVCSVHPSIPTRLSKVTFGNVAGANLWPTDFDKDIEMKLNAINELRAGDIGYAIDFMSQLPYWYWDGGEIEDRYITPYSRDPIQCKMELRELVDYLRLNGL